MSERKFWPQTFSYLIQLCNDLLFEHTMNLTPASWHPYSDIPFTAEKNILTFKSLHYGEKYVLDAIYIDGRVAPTPLEILINGKSVPFTQVGKNIMLNVINHHGDLIKIIFGHNIDIQNLRVTIYDFGPTGEKIPKNRNYVQFMKGETYRFGPFTGNTDLQKFLPSKFYPRKFIGTDISLYHNNNMLEKFSGSNEHIFRCDCPFFSIPINVTGDFFIEGIIGEKSEITDPLVIVETSHHREFNSPNFHYKYKYGEYIIKKFKLTGDKPFRENIIMRMQPGHHKLIDESVKNFGWTTGTPTENEITIQFSGNPELILPPSYFSSTRVEDIEFITLGPEKITLEITSTQLFKYTDGSIIPVFIYS